MNPYLEAFHLYAKSDREVSWTDALEVHLQAGAVVSVAGGFVMARRVWKVWDDARHLDLAMVNPHGDCWHVWAAAGDLSRLLALAAPQGVRWVSYQRHGQERVRRVRIAHLFKRGLGGSGLEFRHEIAQDASAATAASAAGERHRQGD